MRVIGITGFKQSGKDTVAGILRERHGYERAAFADTLKSMALAVDPLIPEPLWRTVIGDRQYDECFRLSAMVGNLGWEEAKNYPEVRRFLQRLGSEGVRDHLGPDTWVNALFRRLAPNGKYAIADCRFPNEVDAVHTYGGLVIRIERPGYDSDGHQSEALIPTLDVDYVIRNDDTIEALAERVERALF